MKRRQKVTTIGLSTMMMVWRLMEKSYINFHVLVTIWMIEFLHTRDLTVSVTGPQTVFWTGLSVCCCKHSLSLLLFWHLLEEEDQVNICNNFTKAKISREWWPGVENMKVWKEKRVRVGWEKLYWLTGSCFSREVSTSSWAFCFYCSVSFGKLVFCNAWLFSVSTLSNPRFILWNW